MSGNDYLLVKYGTIIILCKVKEQCLVDKGFHLRLAFGVLTKTGCVGVNCISTYAAQSSSISWNVGSSYLHTRVNVTRSTQRLLLEFNTGLIWLNYQRLVNVCLRLFRWIVAVVLDADRAQQKKTGTWMDGQSELTIQFNLRCRRLAWLHRLLLSCFCELLLICLEHISSLGIGW